VRPIQSSAQWPLVDAGHACSASAVPIQSIPVHALSRFALLLTASAFVLYGATGCRDPRPEPPGELSAVTVSSAVRGAVDAADRSDADRALDAGRNPKEILSFFGLAPAQRVAELGAAGGYTTELMARIVGPRGRVYGQNNRFILERFAAKPWSERLAKPVMANVTRVDAEFDAPLPSDAKGLDVVVNVLFYHDTVWMGVDRNSMNRAVFAALRPGGTYGIVDHSAAAGRGVEDVKTLHRIEESIVVAELERAGFRLDAATSLLRNPKDTRDWNASPSVAAERRGTSDRFVLRFVKPD
jgi:predicted methyltransferase